MQLVLQCCSSVELCGTEGSRVWGGVSRSLQEVWGAVAAPLEGCVGVAGCAAVGLGNGLQVEDWPAVVLQAWGCCAASWRVPDAC